MTKDIAEYLASVEGLSVLCSLDGPEKINDENRIDMQGKGSFDRAIKGLKMLVEAFGERASNNIGISMVFAPPFTHSKLDEIKNFYKTLEWLPINVSKIITYPSLPKVPEEVVEMVKNETYTNEANAEITDVLSDWSKMMYSTSLHNNEPIEFFSKNAVEANFINIHQRPIYSKFNESYPINACCIPGSRRIYITSKGEYLVCERIDGSPIIGNVKDGIDKEKVKKILIDEYTQKSLDSCKSCWATRLCNVCYAHCYTDGNFDMEKKKAYCYLTRDFTLRSLIYYHKCIEKNGEKLKYLNEIEML